MAESTAFSSSSEDVITRGLTITPAAGTSNVPNPTTREELALVEVLYEVDWTAKEVVEGGYKQVALQFPDELLYISVPIYRSLRRKLSEEIGLYVLADTSYGSCCVDEVAAQHINADVIVHYGYSCLSKPSRIPVLYVFSKASLNINHAVESLLKLAYKEVSASRATIDLPRFILIPDVAYVHLAVELCVAIRSSPLFSTGSILYYNSVPKRANPTLPTSPSSLHPPSKLDIPPEPEDPAIEASTHQLPLLPTSHRRYTLPDTVSVSSCLILYVGPESLGLTNMLMTHPETTVISYDPTLPEPLAKVESARTNKLLMRRYAVVQRARDADVIGILVGTLGVASYLPLLSHIRTLLRRHHKKSYTFSVGKLNPSKLANFAEIECFVMVACPENSVIDAKEFLRPIVTPFELFLALRAEPFWPGNYILDFERVIDFQDSSSPEDDRDEDEADQPIFSLATGKYRHSKRYGHGDARPLPPGDSSAVILRNAENALTRTSESAGADFLKQREFQGLEQRLGEDAPSVLEQGRSGIARGYLDDHIPPESAPG